MRVVAGELRGRRIEAPPGTDTRPTTDKVREATFNALGSLDLVRDALVVDMFAGSGALGIEALSRGAAHCTFIERDRTALRTLRDNIDVLGLTDKARVVPGDAMVLGRGARGRPRARRSALRVRPVGGAARSGRRTLRRRRIRRRSNPRSVDGWDDPAVEALRPQLGHVLDERGGRYAASSSHMSQ